MSGSNAMSQARGTMKMRTTAKTMIHVVVLLAAAAFAGPSSAQGVGPYQFEKKAFKPDGTPWTGPVHFGDVIKYVLSYKPGTTNSGPVTIVDKLSSNQTYVAPTKASDPLWTWGNAPYSTANTETYKHPGFGPGTGKVRVTVSGKPPPAHDVGDGTKPIPVGNRVFGVYHHALSTWDNAQAMIDCWDLATLVKCPGYPKSSGAGIATPQEPSVAIRGAKIFFLGALNSEFGTPTIGCFDTSTDSACTDTSLPSVAAAGYQTFGGLADDPVSGRVFAIVKKTVLCREWAGSTWDLCKGWPAGSEKNAVTIPAPVTSFDQLAFNVVGVHVEQSAVPSRVYAHIGKSIVQCLVIATGDVCNQWPQDGVTLNSGNPVGATFSSVPDGSDENGICLWSRQGAAVGCVDRDGTVRSNPAAVGGNVISTFRKPGTGRIYFGQHNGTGAPVCMDYAGTAGGACSGFQSAAPPPSGTVFALTYGFSLDPRNENCMLALGHTNWLWRFDWKTGQVGCETPTTVQTPKIENPYCNSTADSAGFHWNSIHVLTAGAAGELAITQGTNPPVLLTISSGTTNYPMPSGIGPGSGQLSFSFTPAVGAPTTADFEIGYLWDKNPEICYQAKVTCGPVSNTAAFTGSFNGAAVNVSQKVDLGEVDSAQCKPPQVTGCLQDMKAEAKCNPDGTYTVTLGGSGFTANEIAMTSLTPGITVTPAKQPWSATMTWTLSGAKPGQTVTLTANATKAGGGSQPDSDLCCSGEIKITMPDCPKPIDVKIDKEMTSADGPDKTFRIRVTNVGGAISFPAGGLTVTDAVPAGMTVLSVTASNWTCAPATVVGPGTLTCTYNLSGSLAAGAQLPDGIVLNTVVRGQGSIENCATVAIGAAVGVDANLANNRACVPVTIVKRGRLVVRKTVKNNTDGVLTGITYPVIVTCGSASFPLTLVNGVPQTVNNIPYGTSCSVAENTASLQVPPNACPRRFTPVWSTAYMPSAPVIISGSVVTVTVANTLSCSRTGELGSLIVKKEVKYDGPIALPSQIYPVTVTCGSTVTNLNLVPGVAQTVSDIPLNTSCSVVEGTVTTPPNVCRGMTPIWSTIYAPPSPLTINGTVTETIRNTLTCKPVIPTCVTPFIMGPAGRCICMPGTVPVGDNCAPYDICKPPQIRDPRSGQCICRPPGTVLVDGKCVKSGDDTSCKPPQIRDSRSGQCICTPPGTVLVDGKCVETCRPPKIPGPVAGQCICPPGMVQQGGRCVPRIECRSPLIPNAAGTECVCRPGLVQKGRRCVEPVVCKPPATLNRYGACQCPRDMVARGNSCVERERPPTVTPGIPPRGRDNEPPRGGGGDPRGGRDVDPPRGGRDTDPPRGGQGLGAPGLR
jgi:uncharacterized repeat protein (TIGR01451 family)